MLDQEDFLFIGGNSTVFIVPKFVIPPQNEFHPFGPTFNLLSGNFGPLQPHIPVEVPLWVALEFKKRNLCTLQLPVYLSIEMLTDLVKRQLDHESNEDGVLLELPSQHFFESSVIMLKNFSDEIDEPVLKQIQSLLDQLYRIRKKIVQNIMPDIFEQRQGFVLNNITVFELNIFRHMFEVLISELDKFNILNDINRNQITNKNSAFNVVYNQNTISSSNDAVFNQNTSESHDVSYVPDETSTTTIPTATTVTTPHTSSRSRFKFDDSGLEEDMTIMKSRTSSQRTTEQTELDNLFKFSRTENSEFNSDDETDFN
ncbi:hypothetical protein PCE1_001465 [Barthelona sp. PCE]